MLYLENSSKKGSKVAFPGGLVIDQNTDPGDFPVNGWHSFSSDLEAFNGGISWAPEDGFISSRYDASDPSHLRVYDHPGLPQNIAARNAPYEVPTEYDFGLLGLQKTRLLGVDGGAAVGGAQGDIPELQYSHAGELICRRLFSFSYAQLPDGSTELTVTETPGWARNDDQWVDGPSKVQKYSGQRYNEWRSSARARIWDALKVWTPTALLAVGEVATIPEGETVSGTWFGTAPNVAAGLNVYLASGQKGVLEAALAADITTAWLDSVIPDATIDGLASGSTIRQMIVASLR